MRRLHLVLVLSAALVSALLVSQTFAADPAAETLKIGALLPLSGGAAPWGVGTLRAGELMVGKINAEGGVRVSGKKYLIDLVKADTKSNFDVALAQANRLIFDEKIKFIYGPILSGEALAILPITEANKVMVFSISDTPKVLGSDKHYSFRLSPSFSERVPALYMYLNKQRGDAKKVAFVGPNDETGWGNSKVAKDYAMEYGLDVVFEDFVQRGTNDFFPVLTKVLSKNPDVIIPLAFPPGETTLLLQQAHQLGYKKILIAPAYFDPNMLIAKAGPEAVEGFVFLAPDMTGPSSTAGMRELYKGYNEKYKEEYNPIAFPGYVFLWVLKMAIEKAGTLDTTAVAKTMENLEGEMPYGRFSMGGAKTYGAKRQIVYPIFLSQFKNGKAEFIQSFTPPVP